MSHSFVSRLRLVLLAALVVAPLSAQLDTRLAMSTDTMDVYKNPTTVKPEILTVLDMSGSTGAVTWHPNYAPPSTYNYTADNNTTNINSSDSTTTVTLTPSTGTTWTVKVGPTTYTGVTLQLTVPVVGTVNGVATTAGSFIMPDGTPVETWLADAARSGEYYNADKTLKIDSSTDTSPIRRMGTITGYDWWGNPIYSNFAPSSNATWPLLPNHKYFALKATHGRLTYNSKTVDIPIPWKIFDSPSTATTNVSTSDMEDPQSTATPKDRVRFDLRDGRPDASGGTFTNAVFFYNDDFFKWIFTGSNIAGSTGTSAVKAWANGLPALSRLQAIKRAVLQTWLTVQTQVFWAVSALDETYDKATVYSNPPAGRRQTARILADRTSPAVAWLQSETSDGGTPLTKGFARGLAEMVDGSVFADVRALETDLNVCRKQFVILFTDGLDSNSVGTGDPFLNCSVTTNTAGDKIYSGVTTVNTAPTKLNSASGSPSYYNIWTFAGLAANGNGNGNNWTAALTSGSGTISQFAPFSVVSRDGGGAFNPRHPIETLTIGVSMFGDVGTTGSSKNALLLAAGYGKAGQTNFNSTQYVPMNSTATGTKVRFWDCQNASSLSDSIVAAIKNTMEAPPTTTSPVAPMSGLKAGEETYFARYKAEQNEAPLWSGDLYAVRTRVSSTGAVTLTGKDGADLTSTTIDATNALWAASNVLATAAAGTGWNSRKVYTYVGSATSTVATANRFASLDQDLTASSCAFSTSNDTLRTFMTGQASPAAATKDLQNPKIEWLLGKNRTDGPSLLGDIINSTPVVFEYGLGTDNANVTDAGCGGAIGTGKTNVHLRVIFVGTNHGALHAFAEASYTEGGVLKAVAKELWAFVPPEFAYTSPHQAGDPTNAYDQLNSGSTHVYMVDGPAAGYLDESTSTAGYQGIVDNANDKAMVIFGLGKGGRSIYALDVSSLTTPKLAWMIRPDVETDTNANATLAAMGMSTGMPDQARVRMSSTSGTTTTYGHKDVLFIGGGLSTDPIDVRFSKRLGRSLLAVETKTGVLYKTWDFSSDSSMGSVAAGPLAMEVLTGTNLAQRVYFSTRSGGVYALGCGTRQAASGKNPGFRIDSSDPNDWTTAANVRKLFQASAGEYITTSPVPFRLPYGFPGVAISGKNPPQAVGVVVGTGDLWDPMDRDSANPAEITNGDGKEYHRLVMLFDRSDSAAMGYDSAGITLTDLTVPGTKITPTATDYYLKSSDGYFIGFGRDAKPSGQPATETANGVSLYYYHKIVSEPLVFRGALYFTVLKPNVSLTDGSCSGISKSWVYRVADVTKPNWTAETVSGTGTATMNSALWAFSGIPGKLTVLSPFMVGLAGDLARKSDGTSVTGDRITVATDTATPQGPAVRMRTWRIVY